MPCYVQEMEMAVPTCTVPFLFVANGQGDDCSMVDVKTYSSGEARKGNQSL